MNFKSIATRIFVLVIPVIFVTTLSFVGLSYYVSNSQINKTINEKMYESLHAADLEMQLELYKNASVAECLADLAVTMDINSFSHEKYKEALIETMTSNKNTFAAGIWFEPYKFDEESYHFGPFLYTDKDKEFVYVPDYGELIDYFKEHWYINGKHSNGSLVWSKVYYDPVSAMTMITASKPFYNKNGKFMGIGTADMNLENIRRIVNSISVGETGRAFVVGSNGEYISFYNEERNVNNTIWSDPDEELARLGRELLINESGTSSFVRNGKRLRVYYMTMTGVDWTLAMTFDESEITSSALSSFMVMTIIPILGLLFVTLGIYMVINYLKRIVNKVNDFADLAASGDFSKRIDVTEADEFGFMEQSLNKMISNMNDMSNHSAELLKIAENASKSKSEFLSRMSHEIRTPMNAIIGMTQIAKSTSDAVRIGDCLSKIENASKHLLALINDILDMSKIEANKLELTNEEFDLRYALTNVCNMMLVKTEEKRQKFTISVDENIPTGIISDELRFSQVLTNLIGNAVKFTPENGSISVHVSEKERCKDYSVIKICVTDSGIGLSEEQRAKLFKSFEQVDGSISRKFGGTGLGLAISKRIVEMMGGSIIVTSEIGKGSSFEFTIKALISNTGGQTIKSIKKDIKNLNTNFENKTILIAEDIDINREIVAALLECTGINIEFAENGISAVDMFSSNPDKYDLILMDIQMPEMDGFKATKQIRQMNIKKAGTIPIIAMTANAFNEDVEMCKDAGMNDHMAKPIEPEILMIKLSDYLYCSQTNMQTEYFHEPH